MGLNTWLVRLLGAFAFVAAASALHADDTQGETVLTVTGLEASSEYSVGDLRQIGSETIETTTIWTEGVQTFVGVPLMAFLQALEVTEGIMVATAINDYSITIPVDEAMVEGPIIAFERNGKAMSIREKGPLWIVYPYDAGPEFQTEVVHSRSIWQLNRIEFRAE